MDQIRFSKSRFENFLSTSECQFRRYMASKRAESVNAFSAAISQSVQPIVSKEEQDEADLYAWVLDTLPSLRL